MIFTDLIQQGLLDTFLWSENLIQLKKYHIHRTQETYQFLKKICNTQNSYDFKIEQIYTDIEQQLAACYPFQKKMISLNLSAWDASVYQYDVKPCQPIVEPVQIQLLLDPRSTTNSSTLINQYKWKNRDFWNQLLEKNNANLKEPLLYSLENEIIETARFNIFCYDCMTDEVYTPPLSSGCLNGVLRCHYLAEKKIDLPSVGRKNIFEKKILLHDLSHLEIYVGNSVRGLLKAEV